MNQQEITATAIRLRELGVPDCLNRWLHLTPASLAANRAACTGIMQQVYRRAPVRKMKSHGKSTISSGHAANLDETGKMILREINKATQAKKITHLRQLKELRQMSKSAGTKEARIRTMRANEATKTEDGALGKKEQALRTARAKGKKNHPADEANLAAIAAATQFSVSFFHDGAHEKHEGLTLDEARAKATEMEQANGSKRRAIVYAVTDDARSFPVPHNYQAATQPISVEPKKEKTTLRGKTAKKPTKHSSSKTDIALQMLRKGGVTRKQIAEATKWPSINLKPIADRHGLKLSVKDGIYSAV